MSAPPCHLVVGAEWPGTSCQELKTKVCSLIPQVWQPSWGGGMAQRDYRYEERARGNQEERSQVDLTERGHLSCDKRKDRWGTKGDPGQESSGVHVNVPGVCSCGCSQFTRHHTQMRKKASPLDGQSQWEHCLLSDVNSLVFRNGGQSGITGV